MADPLANVLTLVGPDLAATDVTLSGQAPGEGVTIVPNTSTANTQTTWRRCYEVTTNQPLTIQTGLPAQAAPGSFHVTATLKCTPGQEFYFYGLPGVHYDPETGVLDFACELGPQNPEVLAARALQPEPIDGPTVYLAVDLAHSVTR